MIVIRHEGFTLKPIERKTPVVIINGRINPDYVATVAPKPYIKGTE
jgi:hypothetical protein